MHYFQDDWVEDVLDEDAIQEPITTCKVDEDGHKLRDRMSELVLRLN